MPVTLTDDEALTASALALIGAGSLAKTAGRAQQHLAAAHYDLLVKLGLPMDGFHRVETNRV